MRNNESDRTSRILRITADRIAGPLGALGSVSTVAMMVAITIDVVSRNFFGRSIPGLLEFSGTMLVATVFLGLAYAGAANAHVSVDLLSSKLPDAVSRRLAGAMWLVGAAMTAWLIVATFERAVQSTARNEITQGLMQWPVYPARWIIVIGLLAFLAIALINAFLGLRGEVLLGEDEEDPADGGLPSVSATSPSVADNASDDGSGSNRMERNA